MNEKYEEGRRDLIKVIERFAKQDGTHDSAIPGLQLIRASSPTEPVYSVYEPSLCIVAQGSKVVMLGEESYQYDPNSYLTASVQLPITGQVLEATQQAPYLSLQLRLEINQMIDVIGAMKEGLNENWGLNRHAPRGLTISKMNASLLDAVLRMVKLLEAPQDIPVLAPFVMREIIYRVLQNDPNSVLRQFATIGSHAQRIAKVIERIHRNFASSLRVDELAAEACISTSSFTSLL